MYVASTPVWVFENLYQVGEGRPVYIMWTEESQGDYKTANKIQGGDEYTCPRYNSKRSQSGNQEHEEEKKQCDQMKSPKK